MRGAERQEPQKVPLCTLTLGAVTLAGKAGENSVKFTGKLSGDGELKPGGYTVTIMVRGADGTSSKPISLELTIVK